MKQDLKGWLLFTKRERRMVLIVIIAMILLRLLSEAWMHYESKRELSFVINYENNMATDTVSNISKSARDFNTVRTYTSKKKNRATPKQSKHRGSFKRKKKQKKFTASKQNQVNETYDGSYRKEYRKKQWQKKSVVNTIVDINSADRVALESLKGIGPVLSGRILKFRNALGGFHSIQQMKQVYNLPDSTFENIEPYLKLSKSKIEYLDLNGPKDSLARHPYVSWQTAKRLVRYREQHGDYASGEELYQIQSLDSNTVRRILPYIKPR